jgi:hypothetical protein
MNLWLPQREVILPRRLRPRWREEGFISPALIGAVAGSRRRTLPPSYYYSGVGSSPITVEPSWNVTTNEYGAAYAEGTPVLCGQTGSITKIAIKCLTNGSGTMKIALYDNSSSPVLLDSGGSVSTSNDGLEHWEDITLGTPYSVSNNTWVQVWLSVNGAIAQSREITGATLLYYTEGAPTTFNNFPKATQPASSTAANRRQAARVYIQ